MWTVPTSRRRRSGSPAAWPEPSTRRLRCVTCLGTSDLFLASHLPEESSPTTTQLEETARTPRRRVPRPRLRRSRPGGPDPDGEVRLPRQGPGRGEPGCPAPGGRQARRRRIPCAGHGVGQRRVRGPCPLSGARRRRQLGQSSSRADEPVPRVPPAPRAGGCPGRCGGRSLLRPGRPAAAAPLGCDRPGGCRPASGRRAGPHAADAEHPGRDHRRPGRGVWPWLVQLGAGRGGMYSYDLLENAAGLGMHSADRILPEYQRLDVGDVIPLGRRTSGFRPAAGDRLGAGTWRHNGSAHRESHFTGGAPAGPRLELGWTFVLQPVGERTTRLLSRTRYDYSPLAGGAAPPAGSGAGAVHDGTAHAAGHQVPGRGPGTVTSSL